MEVSLTSFMIFNAKTSFDLFSKKKHITKWKKLILKFQEFQTFICKKKELHLKLKSFWRRLKF